MYYHSTRSREKLYTSKEAILKGICEDGGLFVSDGLGTVKIDPESIGKLSYYELAEKVLSVLIPDYTSEELKACIENAYSGKFASSKYTEDASVDAFCRSESLTPVTRIGGNYLLELYHGPTQAFKDLALCMLPQLMSVALKDKNRKIRILTATSGDTGKAALSGFAGAENIGITVFYPYEKVSDIQYLQMVTQEGANVSVAAVRGNFDDCQTGVKNIFINDTDEFHDRYGVDLSSANSINVGRLVPQVVYYFDAYRQLLNNGTVKKGQTVDFCVPTGNFGDVLAGYYARMIGLPVGRLIVASNENRVLYDFLTTGTYDRNRPFVKTISPSMDILISSNLERLLYYVSGCSCEDVSRWMEELRNTGRFTVSPDVLREIRSVFDCGFATDDESREAILEAWEKDKRLIDPHTAVGYHVIRTKEKGTVLLSTASPFKFAKDVCCSLFGDTVLSDGFEYMRFLSEKTGEPIPSALSGLKGKNILHKSIVNVSEMKTFIERNI